MCPVARMKPLSTPDRDQRIARDRDLVDAILSGSVEAWHAFVDRYTGLILSVLRQRLFVEDDDEIQSVYVDVLESLYFSKLREYVGAASLATWLVFVTRGKAVDYLRKKRGRRHLPRGYNKLTPRDRRVFQLHFVEGLDFEAVLHMLNGEAGPFEAEDLVASVSRIVDCVDSGYLKLLDYEKDARRRNFPVGRLVKYFYQSEAELWGRGEPLTPEQVLAEGERRRMMTRVEALKAGLPPLDRKLLAMRFEKGWTAKQISKQLGFRGQRKVYTALNRALRRLRELLYNSEETGKPARAKEMDSRSL